MIKAVSPMRQRLADGLFWAGFGLCCLLLVPVCLLLWLIRGIFAARWTGAPFRLKKRI